MSIVTKTGDQGETGLVGGGRVSKADVRIHAYGTVDELNAVLGMIFSNSSLPDDLRMHVLRTQSLLFRLGAELATPEEFSKAVPHIEDRHIEEVESWIAELEQQISLPHAFVLPSGSPLGTLFHLCRTVCRRAERWTVDLHHTHPLRTPCIMYLNRLSDYLFLAALRCNKDAGIEDVQVQYDK